MYVYRLSDAKTNPVAKIRNKLIYTNNSLVILYSDGNLSLSVLMKAKRVLLAPKD